jgi:predicted kinase
VSSTTCSAAPAGVLGARRKFAAYLAGCSTQLLGIMILVGAYAPLKINMVTLHLMVGLPCAGKTTLALTLEREHSAIRLTLDEWHLRLFGQDAEDPEHNARHSLIESLLWEVASRALALGTNVILDFGFWAREEREDFRSRAKELGASSEVHFLDVPHDELLRRLAQRNAQLSKFSFRIPEEMMKPWIAFFQKPTPDELERRD